MKLEDYLKEKLDISLEKATEIVNVFHSYKEEYGHGNHKHHDMSTNNQDIYSMIYEPKEYCESINYNLDKLHCNGCHNNCVLSNPNCGRGKMLKEEILKKCKS